MDRIQSHWADRQPEWEALKGDIATAFKVFSVALEGTLHTPTLNRAEMLETAYCELASILDQLDPAPSEGDVISAPYDSFKEGVALYKAPTGAVEPLTAMKGFGKAAIGDYEQRLLCLDRLDVWNCPLEKLAGIIDPQKLLLDNEQLEIIKKCRCIVPVSYVEHELLNNPRLFVDDVETIAKRHHKGEGTHRTEYWIKAVARARALAVGIKQREKNQGEGGGLNCREKKGEGGV